MTNMIPEAAFKSILFPVDFSKMSEITAPHVRGLAQLTGANITLLNVSPWRSAWYGSHQILPQIAGDQLFIDLKSRAEAELETFEKNYFDGVSCTRIMKEGSVAETITDVAEEVGADLIALPTRGLGRTRPFLIGSTTAKVLHDANCAVWTSPHLATLKPFAGIHHILCTIDRESIPPGFIEEVVRLANSFRSKLSFVTASSLPSHSHLGRPRKVRALHEEFPQAHLRDIAFSSDCQIFEETGSIGNVVREIVEMHDIDLVAVDRGHLKHPFGMFRTHTYEIVLESPCPVLSLFFLSPATHDKTVGVADPHRAAI